MFFPGVSAEQLRSIPLFQGLDDEALSEIGSRSIFIGAHPGIKLVREGESGFDLYIILMGEAEVQVHGDTVARLGPGDVFGEMSLLGGGPRNADVIARSVMSMVTMMVWDFRKTIAEYPVLEERLRDLAAQRAGRA